MDIGKVFHETMQGLKEKLGAYSKAFPPGGPKDPEHPAAVDMLQSLRSANATMDQLLVKQAEEAQGRLAAIKKKLAETKENIAGMLAAQKEALAAEKADHEARTKAAAEAIEAEKAADKDLQGLPALPFEKAHAPAIGELQELIQEFSQIALESKIPHALPITQPVRSGGRGKLTRSHMQAHLPKTARIQYLIHKISDMSKSTIHQQPGQQH